MDPGRKTAEHAGPHRPRADSDSLYAVLQHDGIPQEVTDALNTLSLPLLVAWVYDRQAVFTTAIFCGHYYVRTVDGAEPDPIKFISDDSMQEVLPVTDSWYIVGWSGNTAEN